MVVESQATGSGAFSVSRPAVYKVKDRLALAGSVCRRARSTLLSPRAVRVEHVSATGAVLESGRAGLAAISRRADQACSHYSLIVDWKLADGEAVRACFDRGHPCPAKSTSTTSPPAATVAPPAPNATP